ncbi:MarR family winged helix-turn-helix transcriptional regulator [Desulfatitalea alkaliphila]|uniref:MarR family winged helix-turn-helix transcriptional regulator n=1 Tax=Desulfatitalea alkaliphila TaxID=2929485 RepID=A0AA41R3V4_9BACT|nr:MarR family winged helix-turn-helix transcriptional regulator [Desulfatitalea alkaliphila]MCJ8500853.1 MarR family winged helix-turn-helix transcriptional regulator [Desulfatitalea alkaliphila]
MELKDKDKELKRKCWEVAGTCVAGNLRRVSRAVAKVYDVALKPSGLRGTQFNLMTAIIIMGPVAISKLAEVLAMDRTTLTRNLGPLQKQGLVDISAGDDQRTRIVEMTLEGKQIYQQALPLWDKAQNEMAGKLGKDRIKSLLVDLKAAAKVVG